MDAIFDLLSEPGVEAFGGTGAALLLYRLMFVFLATYNKREDTEQAQASAEAKDAEAAIAKEETTQQLIGVLGDVATTNAGLTGGLVKIKEAITLGMNQSQKTETAVLKQEKSIRGLTETIGRAATAMTDQTNQMSDEGKLVAQTTAEQYKEILKLLRELKTEVVLANQTTTKLVERVEIVETTVEVWGNKVKKETNETPIHQDVEVTPPPMEVT